MGKVGIHRRHVAVTKAHNLNSRQILSTTFFGICFVRNTLAARGLEEPQNSQELLNESESVDLTKFVGPLPFSVLYLKS